MKLSKLFYAFTLLCVLATFTACTDDNDYLPTPKTDEEHVDSLMSTMTLRDKVGQMFWIRPEELVEDVANGTITNYIALNITSISPEMAQFNESYPCGGIILFKHNIVSPDTLNAFVPQIKALKNAPMLCVDEEGGTVSRLANIASFGLNKYQSMTWLCQNGGEQAVYDASNYIGSYLRNYGFDIDFAPVADVNSNPENVVIGKRAFSSDPDSVATMVCSYLKGLANNNIVSCVKHFPGHGDTKTDTHTGYAETKKNWDEMLKCEMIPFKAAINNGVQMVMTAHITAPNVDPDSVPSTLSSIILQDKLRKELGYNGIIITDGMEMGAIMKQYTSEEAAVKSIQAGVDVILCTLKYKYAFDAVVDAVNNGKIKESRIDESVKRILLLKRKIGKI